MTYQLTITMVKNFTDESHMRQSRDAAKVRAEMAGYKFSAVVRE